MAFFALLTELRGAFIVRVNKGPKVCMAGIGRGGMVRLACDLLFIGKSGRSSGERKEHAAWANGKERICLTLYSQERGEILCCGQSGRLSWGP